MSPADIQRALRWITSPESKFPLALVASLSGLSRMQLYRARDGNGITERVQSLLSPLLSDVLSGRVTAYRVRNEWRVTHTEM